MSQLLISNSAPSWKS